MADALTYRCDMHLTLRHADAGSRDHYPCSSRAEFWVSPIDRPSRGKTACTQHVAKALRAVMAAVDGAPVKVETISPLDAKSEA